MPAATAQVSDNEEGAHSADLNTGVLRPLALYVLDRHGRPVLEELARASSLAPDEVLASRKWVAFAKAKRFLEAGFELLGRDESEFRQAMQHRYGEAYGPMVIVLWAVSVGTVIRQAMRTLRLVWRYGKYETLSQRDGEMVVRYTTTKDEGRLFCLARQANTMAMPTLWGLPAARMEETKCVGWGDQACIYRIRWVDKPRAWWIAAVLAVGVAAMTALSLAYSLSLVVWVLVPAVTALVAAHFELRRAHRASVRFTEEGRTALETMAREEAEARVELEALRGRQARWTEIAERQLVQRSGELERVAEGLRQLLDQQTSDVRGLSHDLRSPLQVLRTTSDLLERRSDRLDERAREQVRDQAQALERMEKMLNHLLRSTSPGGSPDAALEVERIETTALRQSLEQRLRALTRGRDVRIETTAAAGCPASIRIDALAFDRVLDNLATNAAKHTESGDIRVHVGGGAGRLFVEVTDTGPGMVPEKLRAVFELPDPLDPTRSGHSGGVGLAITARVITQLGGALEAASEPGQGSRFRVFVPLKPIERPERPPRDDAVIIKGWDDRPASLDGEP